MRGTDNDLREINITGAGTQQWGVGAAVCPALALHGIRHVGFGHIAEGYYVSRPNPSFSHVNACWDGAGLSYCDGKWIKFVSGMVGVFPKHFPHGARSLPDEQWKFTWVLYDEPGAVTPTIQVVRSVFLQADPRPIQWAVNGLYRETTGPNDPVILRHWAAIIHLNVQRLLAPVMTYRRLWRLWETVDLHLDHAWSNAMLAAEAGLSAGHLRRLSIEETGRPPMHHVTYLRMQRAADLLKHNDMSVEAVALTVGYQNEFAFSVAFKRWFGTPPSQFRFAPDVRIRK